MLIVPKAKMIGMKIQNFRWVQLIVYFQLIVYKTKMSHLETSNADSAQTKDDWNENLEFWGVQLIVYFQLIVNKTQMSHSETYNAHSAQSKDDWNENLEILWVQLFVYFQLIVYLAKYYSVRPVT